MNRSSCVLLIAMLILVMAAVKSSGSLVLADGLRKKGVLEDASQIHQYALYGNVEKLTKALERDPTLIEVRDAHGLTPLHAAATGGSRKTAEVLVEFKANPNSRANDGATPLHVAAQQGSVEVVQVLLMASANPNLKNKSGLTPKELARKSGHQAVVRVLEDLGQKKP